MAVGCGQGGGEGLIQVKGKLTNGGQPLQVKRQDIGLGLVQLEFYRLEENGRQSTDPESARVDSQGNFTVPGHTGKGIAPGKYRIAVRQWDPYPSFDRLGGKFDAQHSPIIREIRGPEELSLDVAKSGK